jgi:hypothetical protein
MLTAFISTWSVPASNIGQDTRALNSSWMSYIYANIFWDTILKEPIGVLTPLQSSQLILFSHIFLFILRKLPR